ncbi:methylmalonyl-CoA epimerase [Bacillus sp. FJAT-47783]|uniref:methylmalonyl-CoA epimerase n=1 Tax=Bacillus sp. FJAT-47783 TaxID=2922712 RepID=UPI001FAD2873|nr:methylmalonyl-CoA epimerase [Bacillus sp. FJAT-47783]
MVKKVDHIGIAVHNIEQALPFYTEKLGCKWMGEEIVQTQQVKVAFLDVGNTKIELLQPTTETSPIAKFLEKRGEGIHHIALGVADIEARIKEITEKGVQMIDQSPRKGAGGADIAFMHPKSTGGILFELCEKRGGKNND